MLTTSKLTRQIEIRKAVTKRKFLGQHQHIPFDIAESQRDGLTHPQPTVEQDAEQRSIAWGVHRGKQPGNFVVAQDLGLAVGAHGIRGVPALLY